MRTGLQHFAFGDVIARIHSLEDASPEAWCSHGPGADGRVLSSLSCQTSVPVKQQLVADPEQFSVASGHKCWRRQHVALPSAWAALTLHPPSPSTARAPGGGRTGGNVSTDVETGNAQGVILL